MTEDSSNKPYLDLTITENRKEGRLEITVSNADDKTAAPASLRSLATELKLSADQIKDDRTLIVYIGQIGELRGVLDILGKHYIVRCGNSLSALGIDLGPDDSDCDWATPSEKDKDIAFRGRQEIAAVAEHMFRNLHSPEKPGKIIGRPSLNPDGTISVDGTRMGAA